MISVSLVVKFFRWGLGLMARVDHGASAVLRRFGVWRGRRCPLCGTRKLAPVRTELWTGIPGTTLCTTYCCSGCGEELFAERDGAPMTMAEHATWREAKQMRVLRYLEAELPRATVRPRGGGQIERR
jgi:DNA-directed RNA polymerase subunit RPC12/RpoP